MPNRSRDWCVECESRQWGGSVDHPEHLPPGGGNVFRGTSLDSKDTHTSRRLTTRGRIVEGGTESIPQLTVGQLMNLMGKELYDTATQYKFEHPGASYDDIASKGMNLKNFWATVDQARDSGFLDEKYTTNWIYQNIILDRDAWNRVIRILEGEQETNRNRVWDNSYLNPEPGSRSRPPKARGARRETFFRRLYPSIRGESTAGPDDPHKSESEFGF